MQTSSEVLSPDATPAGADWTKNELTDWAQGDPPMIGWWDTILPTTPAGLIVNDESGQVFRRWWGGPVSGWSVAVTPSYQGFELRRIASMPWRPEDPALVGGIWWRGSRVKTKTTYPLQCVHLDQAVIDVFVKGVVLFPHLVQPRPTKPAPKARVRVEITAPARPRVRVEVAP
jgi:hypothetical protein